MDHSQTSTVQFSFIGLFFKVILAIGAICASTIPMPLDSLDTSPRATFQLFLNCHIKFIYSDPELVRGRINHLISATLGLDISFSNFNLSPLSMLKMAESLNISLYKAVSHHEQCFLYVYMEDELSGRGTLYQQLEVVMMLHNTLMEFPHHFIFFGNFWSYEKNEVKLRWNFYRDDLPNLHVKGLILTVAHNDNLILFGTQLICLICEDTLVDVTSSNVKNQLLQHIQFKKNPQYAKRRVAIRDMLDFKSVVEQNCDIGNPQFRPTFAIQEPQLCLYHVLLSSHNISLQASDEITKTSGITILANGYHMLHASSFKAGKHSGIQVMPFPFLRFAWKYTAFRPKPTFTAALLLEPYDWKTWLVAIVMLTGLAFILSIHTSPSCGGCFDSIYALIVISLDQPHKLRMSGNVKCAIFLIWLVASVVLSEGYKGMILSFLTTPTGEPAPKSLQELLAVTAYRLFYFETFKFEDYYGLVKRAPILEIAFLMDERINATNRFYGSDYLLLKHARMQSTTHDPVSAAAEFLHVNKYSTISTPGKFKIGNIQTTKFAYLHLEFTDSFGSILISIFPKLVATNSIEIAGPVTALGWFTSNGFLFQWFSNSMGYLAAAGFAEAFQNHWKTWNPCIYLRDVLMKLRADYNISNIKVNTHTEVSKCLRVALSQIVVGRHQIPESVNAKALSVEQVNGVFLLTLFCLVGAFSLFLVEWMVAVAERWEGYHETITLKNIKTYFKRDPETSVEPCESNSTVETQPWSVESLQDCKFGTTVRAATASRNET